MSAKSPRRFNGHSNLNKGSCVIPVLLYIDDLVPHEDVDKGRMLNTLISINVDKAVKKPIIVERNRLIVIDGHHRYNALRILGVKVIPAYLADYDSDVEDVGGWMYVGSGRSISRKVVMHFVEELESTTKRGSDNVVTKVGDTVTVLNIDRIDMYLAFKELMRFSSLPDMAKVPLDPNRCLSSDVCIQLPKLVPEDVYRVATRGETFPPKTTHHRTYLKHLCRTYPLKLLRNGVR